MTIAKFKEIYETLEPTVPFFTEEFRTKGDWSGYCVGYHLTLDNWTTGEQFMYDVWAGMLLQWHTTWTGEEYLTEPEILEVK